MEIHSSAVRDADLCACRDFLCVGRRACYESRRKMDVEDEHGGEVMKR